MGSPEPKDGDTTFVVSEFILYYEEGIPSTGILSNRRTLDDAIADAEAYVKLNSGGPDDQVEHLGETNPGLPWAAIVYRKGCMTGISITEVPFDEPFDVEHVTDIVPESMRSHGSGAVSTFERMVMLGLTGLNLDKEH